MTPTSEKIGNKRIKSDIFGYLTIKFESLQKITKRNKYLI